MTTFFFVTTASFRQFPSDIVDISTLLELCLFPPLVSPKPTPYSKYLLHHWGAAIQVYIRIPAPYDWIPVFTLLLVHQGGLEANSPSTLHPFMYLLLPFSPLNPFTHLQIPNPSTLAPLPLCPSVPASIHPSATLTLSPATTSPLCPSAPHYLHHYFLKQTK